MNDVYIGVLCSPDNLAHYGIKGMKWGVRRYQNKDGSLTTAGKARYSLGKVAKTIKDKNPLKKTHVYKAHTMSDEELARSIVRLKKEAEYLDLQKKVNPGKTYALDVVGSVGKKVLVTAAAGGTLYGLKVAIDGGPVNPVEFGKAVFRGGAEKKK